MTSKHPTIISLFLFLTLVTITLTDHSLAQKHPKKTNHNNSLNKHTKKPCKRMVFYMHDIIYNGKNAKNSTSAIVGEPNGANKTTLAGQNHFGDVMVFNDPITLNHNLDSTPVGRAQGMYFYDTKEAFTAWFAFSFVFNSSDHKGSLNFAGADPTADKTRDISIIGGTGDFFMARGIATFFTDIFQGDAYFRLRVDVKLYECWS